MLWLIVRLAETVPDDDDVVAGAWGAATFVGLILALAVIGWSLNKHLRTAQRNKDAGLFAEKPAEAQPVEDARPDNSGS